MSNKDWKPYAQHILGCIAKIDRILERGSIIQDAILYDAALRNLQTLAEATQNLPIEIKLSYPNIPWKQISAFRNILVHNYLGDIDPETIQQVITQHLAPLKHVIEEISVNHGN